MSLLDTIKAAQIAARKNRDAVRTASLTTLIGDAEMIGKNAGRLVSDQEVVALTKKFIKNNRDTASTAGIDASRLADLETEYSVYQGFLPTQMQEQDLQSAIDTIVKELRGASAKVDMGSVMKMLKERFDGQYDGRQASALIKTAVSS